MNDPVNSPSHYLAVAILLEPIELTARLDSCLGQACQYVFRSPFKGNEVEDLEKACFYLKKWCEIHSGDRREVLSVETSHFVRLFKPKMGNFNKNFLDLLFETSPYTDEKFCEVVTPARVERAIKFIADRIESAKSEAQESQ